jgi:ATP-binding cassette subfamily C protein
MLVFFILALAASLVGPRLLGYLVEAVQHGTTASRIDLVALSLLFVTVVHAALIRIARSRAATLGATLLAETREDFIGRVLLLPLKDVEKFPVGDLLNRVTTDIQRLDEGIREAMPRIAIALTAFVLTIVAMILTSPLLTVLAISGLPIIMLTTHWYRKYAQNAYKNLLAAWAGVHESTHETITGIHTVDAANLGERQLRRNSRRLTEAIQAKRHALNLQTVWIPSIDVGTFVPMALMLVVGGWAYSNGLAGLGPVAAMVLYIERLGDPLSELLSWLDRVEVATAALRRVLNVSQLPVVINSIKPEISGHDIALHEVRFAYNPGQDTLRDVNLHIRTGQSILITGGSGAGKSTLGKILCGIYSPASGSARIGGAQISELLPEQLRREVAMVTQEQHVFAGSVYDNVKLPLSASADKEVANAQADTALRAVDLEPWVKSLPWGPETRIGDGGFHVPAAIAQQLSLGRLIMANPHIVILDEATALLDAPLSQKIEGTIRRILPGRTVIYISHRLDLAPSVDEVIVMDAGTITESGTHATLLSMNGAYSQFWKMWQGDGN